MDPIINTFKRKRRGKEEDGSLKRAFIPNNAHDVAKLHIDKLMKDPDKLVFIPQPKKEWKPREAPEFVRHVMGSSAGAGSGEFHVYRGLREREQKRNKYLDNQAAKEAADKEYHNKIEADKKLAAEKTAKLRKKRQKKKRNRLKNKNEAIKANNKELISGAKSEESSESEQEEGHFVIGGS